MTMKRRLTTGDTREYPFNTLFTDQERQILHTIRDLRARVTRLKTALSHLPRHACAPPETYKPDRMETFSDIEKAITHLEEEIRWIPGGAYRFAADEESLP